jgi:hypothetical protein
MNAFALSKQSKEMQGSAWCIKQHRVFRVFIRTGIPNRIPLNFGKGQGLARGKRKGKGNARILASKEKKKFNCKIRGVTDEDAANIAVTKGLLFPNVGHKCLMAKDDKRNKVKSKFSTKYATSSDEDNSSDNEDNLLTLFANLNMQQKEKLNELISDIHEKDELLDSQEDFLIKENKKHVKNKNAHALEMEKCEKLTSELSTCHDIIANLRNENSKLIAKVDSSNICDDSLVSLKDDNASLIARIDKCHTRVLGAPRPGREHKHQICWDQVSHI